MPASRLGLHGRECRRGGTETTVRYVSSSSHFPVFLLTAGHGVVFQSTRISKGQVGKLGNGESSACS